VANSRQESMESLLQLERTSNAFFDNLSSEIGFPADQLKYVLCMLLTYPAAFVYKGLPRNNPALKHIFNIVLSISFTIFCLGPFAWLHSFFTALVAYLILIVVPHGTAHKVVFAWVLGYMSVSHIYRQWVDYMGWTLDFTTMQMVLTLRLTSFAYNYYDGNNPNATAEQKKRSIKTLPGILEYYGFVYFFCSYLAGPAIEISEYQNHINGKMFDDKYCQGKIPSTIVPALKSLFKAFVLYLPVTFLSASYPMAYLISEEFLLHAPVWEKIIRVYFHPTLCRFKYYYAWSLTEGACNACGIGYNGVDKNGNPLWDRGSNVDVLAVEMAPNMRSVTTYWNMKTGDWLKNYVYLRLTPEGSKPSFFSTVATYSVSAFWHGFYPGYYLFFLLSAIYTEVAKDVRRVVRPFFVTSDDKPKYPSKYLYDIGTIIVTSWFLNYAGTSFLYLSLENAMKLYTNLYFSGHIIAVIALILFRFVFVQKRSPRPATTKKAQ